MGFGHMGSTSNRGAAPAAAATVTLFWRVAYVPASATTITRKAAAPRCRVIALCLLSSLEKKDATPNTMSPSY
jgi:hypothetical protein